MTFGRGPLRPRSAAEIVIRLTISADDLKQVIFAYPTNGSDIRFML
jgi:hypothetical protein